MAAPAPFQPIDDLAALQVAQASASAGDLPRRLLHWLRSEQGVRTLGEIWAGMGAPVADIERSLTALEETGLVHRRLLEIGGASEPCWWAPMVPFAMPWNSEGRSWT